MNGNGDEYGVRLTRLETIVEGVAGIQMQFANDLKQLLTSQILLTDQMGTLVQRVDSLSQRVEEGFIKLTESQAHTDERLNVLIQMMDWIRRHP